MKSEKTGIVDVGGGFRGIYTAGVLDYCIDYNIHFDLGIGVSAGSGNLITYIAGQRGRSYQFYTEYMSREEYVSINNLRSKKSFIDLDYIYSTLSNSDGENPLDYPAAVANPMEFIVVATEAETGKAKYFDKSDLHQDDYSILKASCSIPFVCHPYVIGDKLYYDGSLADSIPIEKAFLLGCDRVVLLLTLPENTVMTSDQDKKLAALIRKEYPLIAEKLDHQAEEYNKGVILAQKLAACGMLLIIAPDDTCGINTLSRDTNALHQLYQKGYQDGVKITSFLKESNC